MLLHSWDPMTDAFVEEAIRRKEVSRQLARSRTFEQKFTAQTRYDETRSCGGGGGI